MVHGKNVEDNVFSVFGLLLFQNAGAELHPLLGISHDVLEGLGLIYRKALGELADQNMEFQAFFSQCHFGFLHFEVFLHIFLLQCFGQGSSDVFLQILLIDFEVDDFVVLEGIRLEEWTSLGFSHRSL